jgi:CheY-like chemotaxis protein
LEKLRFGQTAVEFLREENGDSVVELFRRSNQEMGEGNIDLIIMDLNMGKMDGDEASR